MEFPNRDPFFHNVFSLFEGKRFDLGLVRGGEFAGGALRPAGDQLYFLQHSSGNERGGDHADYAVLCGRQMVRGSSNIPNVPYGRYLLNVWSESTGPENMPPPAREITIARERDLARRHSSSGASTGQSLAHKNKYGRDYDAPTPDNSVYHQQP